MTLSRRDRRSPLRGAVRRLRGCDWLAGRVRGRATSHTRDEGAASVLVLALILSLMLAAGLVVDGGRAVNARAEIRDVAEQAARLGANQVDMASLRTGGVVRLDAGRARAEATDYLAARGYPSSATTVTVDGTTVTVTAREDVPTALLSLAFIHSFEVQGRAVARAAVGIDREIGGAP